MIDEFITRSEEYEKKSAWVCNDIVCGHAIDLLLAENKNLGNILDAGGGTGVLANAVAHALPHRGITVIDISPSMLAKLPSHFNKAECAIESVERLNSCFDTILCRQVLHYVDDPSCVIDALTKVLERDGILYIGQIVAPDSESAEWLQNIAGRISPSRKRVWQVSELLSLVLGKSLKLNNASIHTFTDTLNKWMQRSTVQMDRQRVLHSVSNCITPTIRKSLGVSEQNEDISFEVLFFHATFSKRTPVVR